MFDYQQSLWSFEMASRDTGGLSIPPVMVFRPSWEEFQDFRSYMCKIEEHEAHRGGLAKVCTPIHVVYDNFFTKYNKFNAFMRHLYILLQFLL